MSNILNEVFCVSKLFQYLFPLCYVSHGSFVLSFDYFLITESIMLATWSSDSSSSAFSLREFNGSCFTVLFIFFLAMFSATIQTYEKQKLLILVCGSKIQTKALKTYLKSTKNLDLHSKILDKSKLKILKSCVFKKTPRKILHSAWFFFLIAIKNSTYFQNEP